MWRSDLAPDGAACGGRGASRHGRDWFGRLNASGGDIFSQKKQGKAP